VNRTTRLIAFWAAVAGVAFLTEIGTAITADKFPNSGFAKLNAYKNKGSN
jgi:hypothetical protein